MNITNQKQLDELLKKPIPEEGYCYINGNVTLRGTLTIGERYWLCVNANCTLTVGKVGTLDSSMGNISIRRNGGIKVGKGGILHVGQSVAGKGKIVEFGGVILYNGKRIAHGKKAKANLRIVAKAALAYPDSLEMSCVHKICGTSHCIAGWACMVLPDGNAVEESAGWHTAGMALLGAEAASHFYDTNKNARKYLQQFID